MELQLSLSTKTKIGCSYTGATEFMVGYNLFILLIVYGPSISVILYHLLHCYPNILSYFIYGGRAH